MLPYVLCGYCSDLMCHAFDLVVVQCKAEVHERRRGCVSACTLYEWLLSTSEKRLAGCTGTVRICTRSKLPISGRGNVRDLANCRYHTSRRAARRF